MKTKFWVASGLSLFLAAIAAVCSYWISVAVTYQIDVKPKFDAINFLPVMDNAINNVDLVIAIDNSGSMYYGPATDPDDLRVRASELVITSLAADIYPRETSVSVVSFGSESKILAPLTRLQEKGSRKLLVEKARETGHDDNTNIIAALDNAYTELFESQNRTNGNVPAVVLLTDGVPTIDTVTGNYLTIPQEVQARIDNLSNKGALIFVILLRGGKNLEENEKFEEWRQYWSAMAFDQKDIKYYEARQASDLEEIYNDIRNRLDNIGVSSGRIEYDPSHADEKIVFPPNLRQARLIIRKPDTGKNVELLLPDGSSAEGLNDQIAKDPTIGELDGFFKVYTLKQPIAGDWRLRVTPSAKVQYIIDFQSAYSAQLLSLKGQDFLNLNEATTIYADVVDENLKSAGGGFMLEASLFKDIDPTKNVFGREEIKLGKFTYDSDMAKYILNVRPESIPPQADEYTIELSGVRESDGTLVNLTRYKIASARMPGDASLSIPNKVECADPTPEISNYRFLCSTDIPVKLTIARPEELSKDDLSAKISGVNSPPVSISEQPLGAAAAFGEFEGKYGTLPYPGDYMLTSELNGKSTEGFTVIRQARAKTTVFLPGWIADLQRRLTMTAILLTIIGLWKPVIVWILSWILLPLNLVPKGRYNSVSTQSISDDIRLPNKRISQVARQSRCLFGVRIGPGEAIPIRYPPLVRQVVRPRGWVEKMQNSRLFKWFFDESEYSYWSVRVIPFIGIVLCEDENETSISDNPATTVNIGTYTVFLLAGESTKEKRR